MRKLALLALLCIPAFAQEDACFRAKSVTVDFTGTAFTAVPAVPNQIIRVCSIALTAASAADLALVSNPTANVLRKALSTTNFTDNNTKMQLATNVGESLGVTASVSVHVAGSISYVVGNF